MKYIIFGFISIVFGLKSFAHGTNFQTASEADIADINFNHLTADFNGDGVLDKVSCKGAEAKVIIWDGSKKKKEIYSWDGPKTKIKKDKSKLVFNGCQIAEIVNGLPSVFISATFIHPTRGARVRSRQYILQNIGNGFRLYTIKLSTSDFYLAPARSVKCHKYPHQLVSKGFTPGVLCFYSAYDSVLTNETGSNISNYGTTTALFKFEQKKNKTIKAIDLTASSELPWVGYKGTLLSQIPIIRMCSGVGRYDGLHMMDSAFIDFNNDGLRDIVTAGQHASLRSHQLVIDKSKPQGIRFITSKITQARCGEMTEFLTLASFSENEPFLNTNCVYVTGEYDSNYADSHSVPDHLRCYSMGLWKKVDLPGKKFSSGYRRGKIKTNGAGKLFIKAAKVTATGKFIKDNFFKTNHFGSVKNYTRIKKYSNAVHIIGWVCQANTMKRMNIILSSKPSKAKANHIYADKKSDLFVSHNVKLKCLQPNEVAYRFNIKIPRDQLKGSKKEIYVYADHKSFEAPLLLNRFQY